MTSIQTESDSGQTMAEYAVVLTVITAVIVTSFALLSGAVEAAVGAIVDLYHSIT